MAKYNIIGDIHGRDAWRDVVRMDCINIFIGDYLDPREDLPVRPGETEESAEFVHLRNFIEILEFLHERPQDKMLLGNHDVQYLKCYGPECNSYDPELAPTITALMEYGHVSKLLALSLDNKVLVTHAGVTKEWLEMYGAAADGITPDEVASIIQERATRDDYSLRDCFSMNACAEPWDHKGESPTASPIWVRYKTLIEHNVFKNTPYFQVVGHDPVTEITNKENIYFVDCLQRHPQSLIVDTDPAVPIFSIN